MLFTGCMFLKVGQRLHLSDALFTGCTFFKTGKRLHLFPRFSPVTCFSRLANVYIFSRALHRLHVSQGWQTFTSFPALCIGCVCTAGQCLHLFPRFAPVACFSRLANIYIFSRNLHRLHVSQGWPTLTSFPALFTGYMFLNAGKRSHLSPRFASVALDPALGASFTFWFLAQFYMP